MTEPDSASQSASQSAGEGASQSAFQSAERRRRSLNTTARDMLISMAVIVGLVGVLLLLVPRPNAFPTRSLDVPAAAAASSAELGFAPAVPTGLPPGWTARTADVQRGTDQLPTWHLTYTTPTARYVGVQQTADATAAWEARQVTDGQEQGTRQIGGRQWIIRSRTDRGVNSLVLREPSVTTVVTGTATLAELDVFVAAVFP